MGRAPSPPPVRHLPVPCVSTAFAAKTVPFLVVLQMARRCCCMARAVRCGARRQRAAVTRRRWWLRTQRVRGWRPAIVASGNNWHCHGAPWRIHGCNTRDSHGVNAMSALHFDSKYCHRPVMLLGRRVTTQCMSQTRDLSSMKIK